MKKNIFAVTAFITMAAMVFTICVNTEAKVRMSKKNLTIEVSKTHTLKLKGVKGKIIWKSSKPGVVKVNKKGKITALKKGKATITAKAGKKLYKCAVTVKDKKNKRGLNMATPKPDEPVVIQDNPTSIPDQPAVESQQPTPAPGLPTPKPSKSTPEPTPVPTPDNSGSDISYPGVDKLAAYMDCRISDIDENELEIFDVNGEVIRCFGYVSYVLDSPSMGTWHPVRYRVAPDDELEVVYDGILTIPFNNYDSFFCYDLKGDNMNYSDIRIGDIVDVVYRYNPAVPVERREYTCCAINVHKRQGAEQK